METIPGELKRGQPRTVMDDLLSLLVRLSESYDRYTALFLQSGHPRTNTRAEHAIDKMKVRAKSVRGYKTTFGRLTELKVYSST